ncbi:MAG TPA: M20/M25/M40 family metallo-hydrolase, partial [Tenuifilaceae bacterium]|nr:M20/M25/M40 family metallo-hydrolase [Tenuifilaceae bacterium]
MKNKKLVLFISLAFLVNYSIAQKIDKNILKKHVYTLADDSLMGRGFGTQGARMAADYIVEQFSDAGISPWNGSFKHPFINARMMVKIEGCNIIGWVEGFDPVLKDEFIVIGAHYDHVAYRIEDGKKIVYNGADDNASGTATVIELGRWLAKNRHLLKRSVILIAFDGEEAGLIGSNYLVKSEQIPVDKVKAMFSLDMTGMLSEYGGIDLVGNATLDNGATLLTDLAAKHSITVKNDGKNIEGQTDTAPFGKKGIPSVHVFTSTVSPYHQPEDDANLLDYDGMVKIAEFMTDVIVQLSSAETLTPDKQFLASVSGNGVRFKAGFRLGIGAANHNYQDEFFYSKSVFAFNAGLFSQIRFSKKFSVQPELLYQSVGGKYANGTIRTHEITVPLNFRLRLFSVMDDIVENQSYIFVGPYYSYRFAGKADGEKMDFDNNFYKEDFGIQYGIGFELMKTQLQITGAFSIKSLTRDSNVMQKSS